MSTLTLFARLLCGAVIVIILALVAEHLLVASRVRRRRRHADAQARATVTGLSRIHGGR